MKSTSTYIFSLGSRICSWHTKKQSVVAQSSAEAEYVVVTKVASQAVWLQRILEDIREKQEGGTILYCDNKLTIAIGKNPVNHDRTKHFAIKYHFVREVVEKKEIQLEYSRKHEQLADLLTKALPKSFATLESSLSRHRVR